MTPVDNVKEAVGRLSMHDRAILAHWILLNLEASDAPQEAVDTAWRAEIRKRIQEIRTGKVTMIPADEMWTALLRDYALSGKLPICPTDAPRNPKSSSHKYYPER
ncbi:addiction module protein, partial [candidate division KSB1 bacterium]|nr:addiction module protein [candidate division KSB1 bacterium]